MIPFESRNDVESFYQCDDIDDFIGEGTFASVFRAIATFNREDGKVLAGQPVALKMFKKQNLKTDRMVQDVINEVEILRSVNHPNCVAFREVFQTPSHVVVVMDHVEGEEVFTAMQRVEFTEDTVKSVMHQLLTALDYLHVTLGVVHRDIKPENILLTLLDETHKEYHVTLVDFGLARRIRRRNQQRLIGRAAFQLPPLRPVGLPPPRNSSLDTVEASTDSPLLATPCGTLRYCAPETVRSIAQREQLLTTTSTLLPRIDLYAAGILMYFMLSGAPPFDGFSNKAALYRDMEKGPQFQQPQWASVSPAAKDLIAQLLCFDQHRRPAAAEALKHVWFSEAGNCPHMTSPIPLGLRQDSPFNQRQLMANAFDSMQPPDSQQYQVLEAQRAVAAAATAPPISSSLNAFLPIGSRSVDNGV